MTDLSDRTTILAVLLIASIAMANLLRASSRNGDRCRARPARWTPRAANDSSRHAPKPPWVRRRIVRLKVWMPDDGCRKIAAVFNHRYGRSRKMTVGKTFVANVIRANQLEIVRLRRQIKHRRPPALPKNLIWGIDLTSASDGDLRHTVFGVVDHGTRACLALHSLRTKASIALLRALLDTVERFGAPKQIRTDNEAVFTSRLFRLGLRLLGIRHRRIAPFAPWQNGRIERFFGTFKERFRSWLGVRALGDLQQDLDLFRFWYSNARPHQHLDGRTPAMAWSGEVRPKGRARFVSLWDGLLCGFYFRC